MFDRLVLAYLVLVSPASMLAQCAPDQAVLTGASLASNLDIGVNTSNGRTDWLSNDGTKLIMQYPSGQAWGAAFITNGPSVPPGNRPGRNLSACRDLVLEMNGDPGTIEIGIKDATQPDNGTEQKVTVQITDAWQTYTIRLSQFSQADLTRIYVLTEFIFSGPAAQTARVRNIKYTNRTVLPQFVFGGGWYTALYFTNTTPVAQSFRPEFFSNGGQPLIVPSVGSSFTDVTLAPQGTAIVEALNVGPVTNEGYVSVSLPNGVIGYAIFRQIVPGRSDQEAVVPLSNGSGVDSILIWDDTNFTTAVAVLNASLVNNAVTVTVRNPSGQVIGTTTIQLVAGTKTAAILKNLPGLGSMVGNRGSAEFTVASGSVVVLGLRFGGEAFTSIPTEEKR